MDYTERSAPVAEYNRGPLLGRMGRLAVDAVGVMVGGGVLIYSLMKPNELGLSVLSGSATVAFGADLIRNSFDVSAARQE